MNKYTIRFNKTRGQTGRGTLDHVWRVFENDKEYLFKHLDITVPVKSEKDLNYGLITTIRKGFLPLHEFYSTKGLRCCW